MLKTECLNSEVCRSFLLIAKIISTHCDWEACKTSFKDNDKYYAWRESKMSFGQKSLIKGIPSGKAITVTCRLADILFFSRKKALIYREHSSILYWYVPSYHWGTTKQKFFCLCLILLLVCWWIFFFLIKPFVAWRSCICSFKSKYKTAWATRRSNLAFWVKEIASWY